MGTRLSDQSDISIAVALNLATLITFFVANNPPQSPFRFIVIYPETVVMNIMACRVFRNVKLGYHSQAIIMHTPSNTGNLIQRNNIPGTGGENLYRMGEAVNMPTSAEVSKFSVDGIGEAPHTGLP